MALPAGNLIAKQRHIPSRDPRGIKGHHLICFRIRPFAIEGRFASITWNNALTCLTVNNRRYLEPRKRLLFETCMFSSLAICTQARFQKFSIRERGEGTRMKIKKKSMLVHIINVFTNQTLRNISLIFSFLFFHILLFFRKFEKGDEPPVTPTPSPRSAYGTHPLPLRRLFQYSIYTRYMKTLPHNTHTGI